MTTEDLEALLEGSGETPTLEFKGPMSWDKHSLIKDILAMANVADGGTIVFGIEDETLHRKGLSDEEIATFKPDEMRDQIAPYADPHVIFRCEIVSDRGGRKYAVLSVSPFEELPVICRKNGPDSKEGVVYFRSSERRPQSAAVGSSSDMRAIIETSIARRQHALRRAGILTPPSPGYLYESELGGL